MTGTAAPTAFAHPSEAELASVLDFYQIRWLYEPKTFPLRHDDDGRVVESFAPDFYLPDFDLYLELTTLKQSLVTKKNRKLRRLRELYPGIRIKLFYARDFRAMMLKYGRYALFEAISGTPGQVVPDRPVRPVLAVESGEAAPDPPVPDDVRADAQPPATKPIARPGAEDGIIKPVSADATPRSRSARRRRRRHGAIKVGIEQESGA